MVAAGNANLARSEMKACAHIVGPQDGPGAALGDLARSLGFAAVQPYAGLASAEALSQQTPLMFFLFAAVEDVATLKATADSIRFANARRIRFSPLVYFSESPSVEAIRACVEMGFDDVITLPFTGARVRDRLGRLVDRRLIFFETAHYFGPDRRSAADSGVSRRIEIIRSVDAGVTVIRDEVRRAA